MTFKTQLTTLLESLKQNNQKLTAIWDAGGDQTIITFYIDKQEYRFEDNEPLWNYLYSLLTTQFELPNAGESYNEGGGEFQLDENGDIQFEYNEFYYFEDEENISNVDIQKTLGGKSFPLEITNLKGKNSSIEFFGSTYPNTQYLLDIHFKGEKSISGKIQKAIETCLTKLLSEIFPEEKDTKLQFWFDGLAHKNMLTLNSLQKTPLVVLKDTRKGIVTLF